MNKKLLVAAISGVVMAGAAQAQSSVVLYGKVDAALQVAKTRNGTVSNLAGSESGSRWGVKGSEDLGGGLRAIFQLESGFDASNGTNAAGNLFNRNSTVGLKGEFGTFELGLKDTPLFDVLDRADPFESNTTASLQFSQWAAGSTARGYDRRFRNGFIYTSPNVAGFRAQAVYSLGESNTVQGTEKSLNNTAGLSLIYANGPAYLGLAYNSARVASDATAGVITNVTPHKYMAYAGSYDFNVVKLYAALYTDKQAASALTNRIDQRVGWISASAPIGGMSSVAVTVGRVNDKTSADRDAKQWGVGYFYNLSKRTYFYSTYGSINNQKSVTGSGALITPLITTSGNGLTDNSGKSNAFDFGIVHKF